MPEPGTAWRLPVPGSFRLAPTVLSHGGYRFPPFAWDGDAGVLTRVLRMPGEGPRTIRISEREAERVEVVRDGAGRPRPREVRRVELEIDAAPPAPGDETRAEVEEAVVFMLQLDRDLDEFHRLCRDEPALARIPEIGAGRLLRCPTLWEELAKAICGAGTEPDRAVRSISALARLGEPAGDLHAWPSPATVVQAGEGRLREEAGLGDRAARLGELARRLEEGEVDPGPAEAGALGRDELRALFLSVEGIDPSAAHRLLLLYGHADRLRLDDAALTFLRDRRFGGRTPGPGEIRESYERFGEWRALALWLEIVQAVWWPAIGASF